MIDSKKKTGIIFILFLLVGLFCNAQKMEDNRTLIDKAYSDLEKPLNSFSKCLLEEDCNVCIDSLMENAKDVYSMYLIGGILYNIDPDKSFELHKKAIDLKKDELNFNLEYALELHRKGLFREAIAYYMFYKEEQPKDYRVNVWLSECCINIGEIEKSIEHWKSSNHAKNHTGIDKALHIIHGRTDQIKLRSEYRGKLKGKNSNSAYELIFLDLNWETDWWNSVIQEYFLEKDLELVKKVFGEESEVYRDVITYSRVRKLSMKYGKSEEIKALLSKEKIVLNGERLIPFGKISSDIVRIALMNEILDEKEFFEQRGIDLVRLADKNKDGELLNIYAYLESAVNGKVSESTDKKGWNEYKDERFANSYFVGLAGKNEYDNPDLEKALKDFPHSAQLHWVRLNCSVIEKRDYKADLIELIKKEFKTLGSDQNKYSYSLKSYFEMLENIKG